MGKQIILIILCLSLTACATLFDKTNDNISFTSEPPSANIYLNGRLMGRTPTSFQVSRSLFSGTPQIAVEKEGYKRQAFELTKEFNKISIFNLSFFLSWATDLVSGAVMQYAPTDYRIFLENEHSSYGPLEMKLLKLRSLTLRKSKRTLQEEEESIWKPWHCFMPQLT